MHLFRWLVGVATMSAALHSYSAEEFLKVGSEAPKLRTGTWLQGEPVVTFEHGKAYLIEFWATWCPPCRRAIPHLDKIHRSFKDKGLVVIGQNCWKRDDTQVPSFIKSNAHEMAYRVVLDDKSENPKGKMAETWMDAAGLRGNPATFIVNRDGVIAWMGHPEEVNNTLIESLLDGSYDLAIAAKRYELESRRKRELRAAADKLNELRRQSHWAAI